MSFDEILPQKIDDKKINKIIKSGIIGLANKYETKVEDYLLYGKRRTNQSLLKFYEEKFVAFHEPENDVKIPKSYIWEFLNKEDLDRFMKIQQKSPVKKIIASLSNQDSAEKVHIKVFVDLMYHVRKFCLEKQYELGKCGAILSQFYLTHLFFTSQYHVSAEKVYSYFKELMMSNSLPFPPNCTKIFAFKETNEIMHFFCKIYLRHLPLIRLLSLPNFAFHLTYDLPQNEVVLKIGKVKNKKK